MGLLFPREQSLVALSLFLLALPPPFPASASPHSGSLVFFSVVQHCCRSLPMSLASVFLHQESLPSTHASPWAPCGSLCSVFPSGCDCVFLADFSMEPSSLSKWHIVVQELWIQASFLLLRGQLLPSHDHSTFDPSLSAHFQWSVWAALCNEVTSAEKLGFSQSGRLEV